MKTLPVGMFLVMLAPGCLAQCTSIPLSYCGRTDQSVASGAAPQLGAAGTATTDPDFGGKVLRVTQNGEAGEAAGHNYITPAGYNPVFSPDDRYILFHSDDTGVEYVQAINIGTSPITISGSPINVSAGAGWYHAQGFSFVSDIVYGWGHFTALKSWDLISGHAAVKIVDFKTDIPGFTVATPYSPMGPWWDKNDAWFCVGSDQQDAGTQLGCYNKSTTNTQVLNLAAATEQQNSSAPVALDNLSSAQLAGCGIHEGIMGLDGAWIELTLNGCTGFPTGQSSGLVFWQLGTNHIVVIPVDPGSHLNMGYGGFFVVKSSNTCNTYDQRSWTYASATSLGKAGTPHYINIPGCVQNPGNITLDAHETWLNNQNTANVNAYPNIVAPVTGGANTGVYMEWEIDAIQTTAAQAQWNLSNWNTNVNSTVWRLAHTFNEGYGGQCSDMSYATPSVSLDGKYISFVSDWQGQTGTGTCTNNRRIDVFILDATTSVGAAGPTSPKSLTATVR